MTGGVNVFTRYASATFALMPLPGTLSGRVTETAPNEAVPIAGARVTLANRFLPGSARQVTVTTDQQGRFSASIVCPCQLRVEAEGYDPADRILHPHDSPVHIRLSPKGRIVTETIGSPGGRVRQRAAVVRDGLDVDVPGGARYEIRITGGDWSAVTITRPI
jgi:hypothetical protein